MSSDRKNLSFEQHKALKHNFSGKKSSTYDLSVRTKPSQSPPPSLAPQKRRYVIDLTSDDPHDSISSKKSRSGIINDSEADESNDALRKPGKTPLPESNFEKHVLPKEYIQVVIPVKPPYQSLGYSRSKCDATGRSSTSSKSIPIPKPFDPKAAEIAHAEIEATLDHNQRKARRRFRRHLKALGAPEITLHNDIDGSTPSNDFKFVNDSILGEGVTKASDDFMIGCECRAENGRKCGCEYLYCMCLEDAATKDGHKVFPYSMGQSDRTCLRNFYLTSRWHIYECNKNCNCQANCKNRVVQFGRKVSLQIFKTTNRGWGLRCLQPLQKGQFVDTYRGEIITSDEADRRGETRNPDEGNYFMDLDKFEEPRTIPEDEFLELHPDKIKWHATQVSSGAYAPETSPDGDRLYLNPLHVPHKYVCDGMHVGGPTRFINHSCEPNLQVHTASYNHADSDVYDLAFFAKRDIPRGEELTFDYKDENDRDVITDEMAGEVEREKGYAPQKCLCGTEGCRGYFFN